jgi:hypothetical protein
VPMMPDDAGDAQAFFFGRWISLLLWWIFLQSSAIISNRVIGCYCVSSYFSTNLEICVVLGFFWARGWIEVTLLAEQTGTWDVFWFCLDMSQKLGTTALAKYLFVWLQILNSSNWWFFWEQNHDFW